MEKKTVGLPKPLDGSAAFGSNMDRSMERRTEVTKASCVEPSPEEADIAEIISSETIEGTVLIVPPKEQTSVSNTITCRLMVIVNVDGPHSLSVVIIKT